MVAGQLYWLFGAWQYRDPEAMAPTPRRIRVAIYSGSAYVAFGVAIVVAAIWRGDGYARAWAFAIALWAGLALACLIIAVTRRSAARRDADRAARRAPWRHIVSGVDLAEATEAARLEGEEESPSEPSEAAYGLAYLSLGVNVAIMVIVSIVAISLTSPSYQAERRAQSSPTPLSPAERRQVDAIFNQIVDPTLPVASAAADGQVVVPALGYVPADVLTGRSQGSGQSDPSGTLSHASIALEYPGACTVRAVVVQESADTVTVGFAVDAPAAGTSPTPMCLPSALPRFWYPVRLGQPLGARHVVTPTGTPVFDASKQVTAR